MQPAADTDATLVGRLLGFAKTLIDQRAARIIVAPERAAPGFWFGGGKMARGPDGDLYLTGRYRSAGDSRTGLDLGDRGRELAVFRSADRGASWEKILSFGKAELAPEGREVLSIEGSVLRFAKNEVRLFVSSEKRIPYPEPVESYMKPGTGVWTIERLSAPTLEGLRGAMPVTVLESRAPERLHLKDPYVYENPERGTQLGFCHHPFSWSSTNSAIVGLDAGGAPAGEPYYGFLGRGPCWDVAITRATSILDLPPIGALASAPRVSLVFYDGGECLRSHEEHSAARSRPRGYSCEELGSAAYCLDGAPGAPVRLSPLFPLFVSPWGTGSSRYVDVLRTEDGFYATWQQSQADRSQALVMRFMAMDEADRILS